MSRSLTWLSAGAAVLVLTIALGMGPSPLPAAPPPIRLDGEITVPESPQTSLVVVPPPVIRLPAEPSEEPITTTSLAGGSPSDLDDGPSDSPDSSADSVDD
jgi:hypothetical protein